MATAHCNAVNATLNISRSGEMICEINFSPKSNLSPSHPPPPSVSLQTLLIVSPTMSVFVFVSSDVEEGGGGPGGGRGNNADGFRWWRAWHVTRCRHVRLAWKKRSQRAMYTGPIDRANFNIQSAFVPTIHTPHTVQSTEVYVIINQHTHSHSHTCTHTRTHTHTHSHTRTVSQLIFVHSQNRMSERLIKKMRADSARG